MAMVNMPNTLLGFGKARKMNRICVGNEQLLGFLKVQDGIPNVKT
jgi:hypothetical protein